MICVLKNKHNFYSKKLALLNEKIITQKEVLF